MKKNIQILIIFALISQAVMALDDKVFDEAIILSDGNEQVVQTKSNEKNLVDDKTDENFEQPIILEPDERFSEDVKINPYTKDALRAIIEKEYDLNSPFGLFQEQLTFKFKKGPIKEHWSELMMIHNFSENITKGDSDFGFGIVPINIGLFGKFRSEKESYFIIADATPDNHMNFFKGLILDAWIESKRIPNHKIKVGKFRPMVGYEGSQCAFLVPLSAKSQIARHFSNARKTGISINGDYKYFDYYIEGFNSDIQYDDFFPGIEGDLWFDIKPLAKADGKYGDLKIGGGYQAGNRNSHNYNVSSAALRYDYKKFWMSSEVAYANGSNGTFGINDAQRFGYNVTLAYRPTKKLELLLRYDDLDNDTNISNNNTKEYTAGFNYYIYGQALRIICNYVYSQKDAMANSHKIILGTQIAL